MSVTITDTVIEITDGARESKQDAQIAAASSARTAVLAAIAALQAALPASPETGLAKDASLTQIITLLDALATAGETQPVSIAAPVAVQPLGDLKTTGTIASGAGSVGLTARPGDAKVEVALSGTWSANMVLQASQDNGTTWLNLSPYVQGAAGGPITPFLTANGFYQAVLPASTTDVRVAPFSFASGSAAAVLALARSPIFEVGLAKDTTLAAQSAKLPAALSAGRLTVEDVWAGATATGTVLNANDAVTVNCAGMSSAAFLLASAAGAPAGLIVAQCLVNGNWLATNFWSTGTPPVSLLAITAPPASASSASYRAAIIPGSTQFRVAVFVGTTVVVTVNISVGAAPDTLVMVGNALPIASLPTPTPFAVTTTASTNASIQKNAAATLTALICSNPTATAAYVKVYNKASAPTVGTDIPVITVPVAAGATVPVALGVLGHRFTTGIALACTAAGADADAANAVAGVKIIGDYV